MKEIAEQYPEAWKEFHDYVYSNYDIDVDVITLGCGCGANLDYDVKFPMLWGIFLEFFDSKGVYIDLDRDPFVGKFHFEISQGQYYNRNESDEILRDTRQEAQLAAITQAFKHISKMS